MNEQSMKANELQTQEQDEYIEEIDVEEAPVSGAGSRDGAFP